MTLGVGSFGSGAEPQIPLEVFRDWSWFWIWAFVSPSFVAPGVGFTNLSDGPTLNQFDSGAVGTCGVDLRTHLGDNFVLFRDESELSRFVDIVCEWFLAIDMFAVVHRGHCSGSMGVVWSGDRHSIDFASNFGEHLAKVGESFCIGVALSGGCEVIRIDIAEGNDIDFGVGAERSKVGSAHSTDSDACKSQSLIVFVCSFQSANGVRSCDQCGGIGEE